MTGEPRPRYNALQLLGESGACDHIMGEQIPEQQICLLIDSK